MEKVQADPTRGPDHLQPYPFNLCRYAHSPDRDNLKADNLPRRGNGCGQSRGPVEERAPFHKVTRFLLQLLLLQKGLDGRVDSVNGQVADEIGNHIIPPPIRIGIPRLGIRVRVLRYPNNGILSDLLADGVFSRAVPFRILVQVIVGHNGPDIRQRAKRVRRLESKAAFALRQVVVYLVLRVVVLLPTHDVQ